MQQTAATTKTKTENYLTARELSRRWKVHQATVYRLAKEGRIPSVCLWAGKRRRTIRFPESAIIELELDGREG